MSLGMFPVVGTKLMVTDPCYSRDLQCQGIVDDALPGMWEGHAEYIESRSRGTYVSAVEARHQSFSGAGYWAPAPFETTVDSGQAGIFDEARYPQGECGEYDERGSFYNRACAATLGSNPCDSEKEDQGAMGGVIAEGVVTSSGSGDGTYRCEIHRNTEGKVDAVKIIFLKDDYDEEDEDDYDEDEDDYDEDE